MRQPTKTWRLAVVAFLLPSPAFGELQVSTFIADVTPPKGAPLCDALCPPAIGVNDPLSARGLILYSEDQLPIVLVAVDWVGIGNQGNLAWRQALAKACQTNVDRVCVHSLHQHDAPGCDFLADDIAATAGLAGRIFPVEFAHEAIDRVADAARHAMSERTPVTHLSYGLARVEQVASNRRILGDDGKVKYMRMTACTDPIIRDQPEGLIDPFVRSVGFWNGDRPVAVLTYYATHPQSYYRTGMVSADFVGMARDEAQQVEGTNVHIHFNGAGGNIGAGKYNDGSVENRPRLAGRLAKGMEEAWSSAERVAADDLKPEWKSVEVQLPTANWYDEAASLAELHNPAVAEVKRLQAARAVAWGRRAEANDTITVSRLRLGPIDILQLPGELFVEFQLAAQQMRPDRFVCLAAYGDYGPGYIGTADAYDQGGYETGTASKASRVSPRAAHELLHAIEELLE